MFTIRRRWLSSGRELGHAVDEAHALDQFTESLNCGDPVPSLLCFETQLQHLGERAVFGESALYSLSAVAQCGECGLDHVVGVHVDPMLGRKIVEGEELLAAFPRQVTALRYLAEFFSWNSAMAFSATSRPSAIQIRCRSSLALDLVVRGR